MFNLLCIRSSAIPRLTRQIGDPSTLSQDKYLLSDQLEHERNKAEKGRMENALRRHNLLPIVFELFKAMGESGMGMFCIAVQVGDADDTPIRGCPGESQDKREREERKSEGGRRENVEICKMTNKHDDTKQAPNEMHFTSTYLYSLRIRCYQYMPGTSLMMSILLR